MSVVTPNIGIYIPAAGETNYSQAFAQGMINLDQHDHTGGPNKGLPITSTGLADFSVTYSKLSTNVADITTGIQAGGGALANQLRLLGILNNIFNIGAGTGIIVKTNAGGTVSVRTLIESTNQIKITNPDGVSGNPTFTLQPIVLNITQPSFSAEKAGDQNVPNPGPTKVTFSDVALNRNFQQGANYASSIYTAPVTGVYTFSTSLGFNIITTAGEVDVNLSINAGAILYLLNRFDVLEVASVGGAYMANGTAIVKLQAGDTVQVDVTNGANTTLKVFATSHFCGALLY